MFRKLISGLFGALLIFSLNGPAKADSLDVGTWGGGGGPSGLTRGYWFTAPTDFIIDSIFLQSGGSSGSTLQVLLLDEAPPSFPGATFSFTSLGFWSGLSSASTSIAISSGDIIGVLGYDGVINQTPYRDAIGPYETVIGNDLPMTLYRFGFQDLGDAVIAAQDETGVWTEAGAPIGSIGMTYHVAAVPEPETYAMLLAGLGLLGFAARRRKQKEAVAA